MEPNSYKCLRVTQRDGGACPVFVLFSAKASHILQWANVEELNAQDPTGSQRIEKPFKTKSIDSYFRVDPKNTIPTAVVIGFRPEKVNLRAVIGHDDLFEMVLSEGIVGTIVDGQHRVKGANKYAPDTRLNVVGLLDVTDTETAFQFLVINNKSARVSSDHLRALALRYERDELTNRLKNVKLNLDANLKFVGIANTSDDSPFTGIIAMPTNSDENRIVPPSAIEDAIACIRSENLPDLVEDDDMVAEVFFTIWREVKTAWAPLWRANSKLLSKVSIVCLTQFVTSQLFRMYDWSGLNIFDPVVVEKEVKKIIAVLDSEFWSENTEWVSKGLDTQAGRKMFLESVEQMVRNYRQKVPWHTDISMIKYSQP
jgi:DGQHR domain-containing protein